MHTYKVRLALKGSSAQTTFITIKANSEFDARTQAEKRILREYHIIGIEQID